MTEPHVVAHPLLERALAQLRSAGTGRAGFRAAMAEAAGMLAYEALWDLPTREEAVETPLEATSARVPARPVAVVAILRAGLGMVDGVVRLMPSVRVGHIGLYRDHETLEPVHYYFKIPPEPEARDFIVLDPMLATGGSASAAVSSLKKSGATRVRFMCLVAAPEGVERMQRDHPDVSVYAAALDRELDGNGYIRPGLGDAGDRLFGTKGHGAG